MSGVENSGFGSDMLKNMINMKMMTKLLKEDGLESLDFGKLYLMQCLTEGKGFQVSEALKAKLLSQFDLEKDSDDLNIEKIALLQMIQEDGKIDFGQLFGLKLLSTFLEEDKEEKKSKTE